MPPKNNVSSQSIEKTVGYQKSINLWKISCLLIGINPLPTQITIIVINRQMGHMKRD